jgi:fructose-1,6-bisphosphatase
MKKTFVLTHPKIKFERLIEAIKHDVKKYIKREQRKTLPENMDFWDFDCKYGKAEKSAKKIHISEINQFIDKAEKLKLESFYLEILSKAVKRVKKPKAKPETKVQ